MIKLFKKQRFRDGYFYLGFANEKQWLSSRVNYVINSTNFILLQELYNLEHF